MSSWLEDGGACPKCQSTHYEYHSGPPAARRCMDCGHDERAYLLAPDGAPASDTLAEIMGRFDKLDDHLGRALEMLDLLQREQKETPQD